MHKHQNISPEKFMENKSIKEWSAKDRPREKLMEHGPRILSDAELIAIIIGSGNKELSAVELARLILSRAENNLSELGKLSIPELQKFNGVGEAKAISISAAMEISRRRALCEPISKPKITSSKEAFQIFSPLLCDLQHEEFWVAYLNQSNVLIDRSLISQGGISGTVADIRLIMGKSLELKASALVLGHNHPSGNTTPSNEDRKITKKTKEAAAFFDIRVIDHIIVANNLYYSFADEGAL